MAGKYLNKLQGKRVLIIGGPSGLGLGVAEACVEFGANVFIASRTQAKIDKAIARLKTAYPNATSAIRGHVVDMFSNDLEIQLKTLFDFATNNGVDKLDHIVNSAGDLSLFAELNLQNATLELLNRNAAMRLNESALLGKYASQYLKQSYESSYTMTSGILAYKPMPGMSLLIPPFAGKEGLTRGLAKDMAPIRTNLVVPGIVETELLDTMAAGGHDDFIERGKKATLLGRIASSSEIAEVYLCAMKSTFMTGSVLHVEGGYYLV